MPVDATMADALCTYLYELNLTTGSRVPIVVLSQKLLGERW